MTDVAFGYTILKMSIISTVVNGLIAYRACLLETNVTNTSILSNTLLHRNSKSSGKPLETNLCLESFLEGEVFEEMGVE